jgi:MoaA/NifB/PqqE/SkfB family radical SAM enzyme
MDPKRFRDLVSIFSREGYDFVYLYHTGEPFLHPNIFDFFDWLRQVRIQSNVATKLSCHIDWERFAKSPLDEVLVTLDSLKGDVAKKVSPGINHKLVFENLLGLAKYRQGLGLAGRKRFRLVVNTTVCSLNCDEVSEISSYVRKLFALYDLPVCFGGKAMGIAFGCVTPEEVREAITMAKDLWTDKFEEVRFLIKDGCIVPLYDKRCWPKGRICEPMIPVVGWSGDLLPCCHDMLYKCVMGNVFKIGSVDAILRSPLGKDTMARGRRLELPICKVCN